MHNLCSACSLFELLLLFTSLSPSFSPCSLPLHFHIIVGFNETVCVYLSHFRCAKTNIAISDHALSQLNAHLASHRAKRLLALVLCHRCTSHFSSLSLWCSAHSASTFQFVVFPFLYLYALPIGYFKCLICMHMNAVCFSWDCCIVGTNKSLTPRFLWDC